MKKSYVFTYLKPPFQNQKLPDSSLIRQRFPLEEDFFVTDVILRKVNFLTNVANYAFWKFQISFYKKSLGEKREKKFSCCIEVGYKAQIIRSYKVIQQKPIFLHSEFISPSRHFKSLFLQSAELNEDVIYFPRLSEYFLLRFGEKIFWYNLISLCTSKFQLDKTFY